MFDNGRWTAGTLQNQRVADKPHSFNEPISKQISLRGAI